MIRNNTIRSIAVERAISKKPVSGKEKRGRNRPVISLKQLNASGPYTYFKMEGLIILIDQEI